MYMVGTVPSSYASRTWRPMPGLGATPEQVVIQGGAIATPIITGALASSAASAAAAGAGSGLILGMAPALAVPVIGAAIVGVTAAVIGLIYLSKGCGQTCIATSEWANQAEELLKQNLAAYQSSNRSKSAQNTALSNFNVVWARLQQLCGDPATGDAGKRCISDRQQGACKWRDTGGQCWNWFTGYYDPIKNDPNVVDDSIGGAVSSLFSSLGEPGSNALPLLLGAGLILAAVTVL